MSSPPCLAQIDSLNQRCTKLRMAVEEAADALHALASAREPSDADAASEAFMAADRQVSILVREIAAILDR